jgi:2,5-diketo-D-gluconate reductase A
LVCGSSVCVARHAAQGPDYVQLNTGAWMPLANLGGTAQSVRPGDHYSNYSEFLRVGGCGIDTALTYTDTINVQIADAIAAHPSIPRPQLWVTTKVPCCPGSSFCSDPEYNISTLAAMAKNNALLRLKTTELTLLHHPCTTTEETIQAWLQLELGLRQGLTKAIGTSNFNAELLAALAADPRTHVTPAVNQCNHAIGNHNKSHAPTTGGDDETVSYCAAHGIAYSAYSPLEGLHGGNVFELPKVVAVAARHNVSGAQVALRWLVQQSPPISVVTAAHRPQYIAEDLDLFSWGGLTPQEMVELAAI